jgi:hypothetical protein
VRRPGRRAVGGADAVPRGHHGCADVLSLAHHDVTREDVAERRAGVPAGRGRVPVSRALLNALAMELLSGAAETGAYQLAWPGRRSGAGGARSALGS